MKCGATGKVRHVTRGGAEKALSVLDNAQLNAYRCKACGGWHLGNSNDPVRIQARIDQLLGKTK